MKVQKNDNIRLKIESLTSEGSGLGRYDNMAVFVRSTVPGDEIEAHIIKVSKNYAVGILSKIIIPSPKRTESDCPYSQKCGGCSFRHMAYDEELNYKRNRVRDALVRIGHMDVHVEDIVAADSITNYRNKAQYPVEIKDGIMYAGFYAYKSHRIVPCTDCLLQPREFKSGLNAFSKWVKKFGITSYDERTGKGLLRHIYFRKAFATGELMACAVINGNTLPGADTLISLLRENVDGLKSVVLNINKKNTNVILGNEFITLWGSDNITDVLLSKKFEISPDSFYQVNHSQCEKLYKKAMEFASLKGGETLLDLYCGVGTIGIIMADRVKQLIGIEIIEQAVENARNNARLNNIHNAQFICADAPKGAEILKAQGIRPDLVVLDPPRKGCDSNLFDTIEQMSPKKMIYISCDSATLARDLAILKSKNYVTKRVAAIDMFPGTPHVESVALIEFGDK